MELGGRGKVEDVLEQVRKNGRYSNQNGSGIPSLWQ
jgi:hypothetical protein